MTLTITETPSDFPKVASALKSLAKKQLKIGLPPSAGASRQTILAIQEHGSPIAHIPARPVIHPALSSAAARQAIADGLYAAVDAAWNGDESAASAALEAAGKAGADSIRAYIDAGVPPPNSPLTVNGGWFYNRRTKKAVYVKGKGFIHPLVDTGTLYASFDYEVSET